MVQGGDIVLARAFDSAEAACIARELNGLHCEKPITKVPRSGRIWRALDNKGHDYVTGERVHNAIMAALEGVDE